MLSVMIDPRFCGPRDSGHGGYSSGMLARYVDGPATVRLLKPPPLSRELIVVPGDEGRVELMDPQARRGEGPVAVAELRAPLGIDPPPPVSLSVARRASAGFMWSGRHPFPSCFACGTGRRHGDAWRVAAGALDDGSAVASPASCPPDLVAPDGTVPFEQVWAALDCITSHPLPLVGGSLDPPWLLGTFAVDVLSAVPAHPETVLMGWPLGLEGRKFRGAAALYVEGRAVAVSSATWIQIRRP